LKPLKKVLAAVDFTEHSRSVLNRALQIAKTWGASLAVLHVVEDLPYEGATGHSEIVDIIGRLEEDATRELDRWVSEMIHDQVPTETEVLLGLPYRELLKWAWRNSVDLCVVGNESRSRLKSLFLGRNAEAIVRKSMVPVWVERKGAQGELTDILLPTDLSDNSLAGVLLGLDWARKTRARVHLVHVVEAPFVPPFSLIDPLDYSQKIGKLGKERFDQFIAALPLDDIPSDSHFLVGDPGVELENLIKAKQMGLAFISTHGTTGLPSKLLGSFCGKFLRNAPCHTVVLRPHRLDFSWLIDSFYQGT
jgi:nucleotide-binding universal stress UspA family protein